MIRPGRQASTRYPVGSRAHMERLFRDRRDAGRVLAERLDRYRDRSDVVVLGNNRFRASTSSFGSLAESTGTTSVV